MTPVTQSSSSTLEISTDAPEYFRSSTRCESVLQRLKDRQDLCDVVLKVGDSDKRISAHRLILIASCDYFSALLSGGMRESQEREVTLKHLDGDSLEKLVDFCYTGILELRVETVKILITTANYLQLKEVTEGCCEFLQQHLHPSNCLGVGSFAEQLDLKELLINAKKFTYENFEKVSNCSEFCLITTKQLSEFLASDDLVVPSEEFVFQVVSKWIEYEPEDRRKHFTELLAYVRLPLLPPTFLAEEVQPLCNTTESQELVQKALKPDLQLANNSTQPRKCLLKCIVKHLLSIYAQNSDQPIQHLEIAGFNLRTNACTKWNTPIALRPGFAVILMDDKLIVLGGLRLNTVTSVHLPTVTTLHLPTMNSAEMAPMRTGRSGHSVVILKGSIYAIGGFNERQYLNSVERWDPASQTWSFVAPMGDARWGSGAAVFNDTVYVSGGYSGRDYLTSVECYDPVKNTWRCTAPTKMGRMLHSLTVHKGFLFAIGGCTRAYEGEIDEDEFGGEEIPVERYDPRTDTWISVSCSTAISGSIKCASLGPELFIYNNFIWYKANTDDSCNNLRLEILPADDAVRFEGQFLALPFEFSPPESWITAGFPSSFCLEY